MQAPQTVLLAGGTGNHLFPLNSTGLPVALMPVANQPLLTFPLRTLEEGGIRTVFVVCCGESVAAKVNTWLSKNYQGKMHLQVKTCHEEGTSIDALRLVADLLEGDNILIMSADTVTDLPLKAVITSHFVNEAVLTSVLVSRKTSPAAATKPGKAPKNVDYVGLDESRRRLLHFQPSPEAARDVRLPLGALQRWPAVALQTLLADQHLYVLHRLTLLDALAAKPHFARIKADLVPYLVRHQYSRKARPPGQRGEPARPGGGRESHADSDADPAPSPPEGGKGSEDGVEGPSVGKRDGDRPTPGADCMRLSHSAAAEAAGGPGWLCAAYIPGPQVYCARAASVTAYCEINREAAGSELAGRLHVTAPHNMRHDNFLHETAVLGNKTTVVAGCMVGRATRLGDKCSVKRSVIGAHCALGHNVRVLNSVLLDGVVLEDGCHVQNSLLCAGAHLQAGVTVRDCQVGANVVVPEGSEHRDEVLARPPPRHSNEVHPAGRT